MSIPTPPAPFAHWMLAEMHEQPDALSATIDAYTCATGFREDAVSAARAWLRSQTGLTMVASGSSRHAGLVGQASIEASTELPVSVEFASEFGLRDIRYKSTAGVVVISQSGETADTLAALRQARAQGRATLAITNAATSSMASEADLSMPVLAGRERAIPATKSFTGQLAVLEILRLLAADESGTLSPEEVLGGITALRALPGILRTQLAGWQGDAAVAAAQFHDAQSFLFLGRGIHYPIANEGALKLKESAYLHAEGYPAGELKHGPNALVSDKAPLAFLATVDRNDASSVTRYEKTLQLMRDMRQQGARIITVGNTGDAAAKELSDAYFSIEEVSEALLPICEVIPLQMFAYFSAIDRDINVDSPRNLVKAVVIE